MMDICKSFRLILVALTASALVLAAGCGGGGGGGDGDGDGGDGFPTPRLPADAVTLDDANADEIARTAVGFVDILDSVSELKTASSPSMPQVARDVTDRVMRKLRTSASVAARTENIGEDICDSGGATATFEESGNSESGSVTFDVCEIGSGIIIDGTFSYAASMNNNLDYSFQVGGSLTMAFSEESITSTIVMNLLESGNDGTGAFSSDVNYSLSGIPDNGILVTTAQPLVGNVSIGTEEGRLIVHGADDTLLRITVTSTNTAAVDLDEGNGIFVPFSTIPIAP
jgi:hypothetical protein